MFEKIECPWCHAEVFAPVDDKKRSFKGINSVVIEYRETVCPECQKNITLMDDVNINLMSSTVVRFDTEDDKITKMFTEFESKHHDEIVAMKKEIDEALGIIRDEWDNPEPVKKIKLVLVSPNNDVLKTVDEVKDYIRENYDESDLRDWIDSEFGDIDIGPFTFSPSDVIDNMGDFDTVAEEVFNCNYADDRFDDSDVVSNFEEINDPDNIDTPDDGEVVEIAGIRFTYKHMEEEKDDSKV